jgi:Cofactor assembly of complex C subunit B
LWSTIKRSTAAKVKNKTFVTAGEASGGKGLREQAGEIMACTYPICSCELSGMQTHAALSRCLTTVHFFTNSSVWHGADMKANNYEVVEAGETITFRGLVPRSLSQAFFLTFCTALGLLSLALVLQIQFVDLELPAVGKPNWFLLAFLSPYAGLYYWRSGDRVDTCQVKLSTNTDETENEIVVQGSEEELERMWRTLEWREKGMVKVEGLLDKIQTAA